jgi:dGTP triphosphohydrolase
MPDVSATGKFRPIKSNDVVIYNGHKHLVVSVHLENNDIKLSLQPLDNSVKTVSFNDVKLINETYVEKAKSTLDLTINKSGREAWDYGANKAKSENIKTRTPYTQNELIGRVKTLLLEEIKNNKQETISQPMVDHVVQRLSSTQAYLVTQVMKGNAVKSGENFIDWRQISLIALKMANLYNQNVK